MRNRTGRLSIWNQDWGKDTTIEVSSPNLNSHRFDMPELLWDTGASGKKEQPKEVVSWLCHVILPLGFNCGAVSFDSHG